MAVDASGLCNTTVTLWLFIGTARSSALAWVLHSHFNTTGAYP